MSGIRRGQLPDGYFHVTARGVNGEHVFLLDLDRLDFLQVLAHVSARLPIRVVARCLMGTHYHLIVNAPVAVLSAAMQQLNSIYARRFNKRHGRRGHLFGERYSSWVIGDETHLHAALEYLLANPVRAGLCATADEWPWSRVDLELLRPLERLSK